jgi:hypothetical protein
MCGLTPVVWTFAAEENASLGPIQTMRMVFLFAVMMFIGVGLICLRKWAALYFSLPLFIYGIYQAFFSIETVTFPLNLLLMLHGLSLTLPLVVTIRVWKNLTWGNRFF